MRISDHALSPSTDRKIRRQLIQVIADTGREEEAGFLVINLFSEAEQLAIAKRLAIALYLTQGRSYEKIKKELKVSSATIAKTQELLDTPGFKMALKKIDADDWAGKWANKLSSAINKLMGDKS